MKNCKLSVIAPCRNEEKFITAFLENMLSQDFPKDSFEIIIADGISSDKTVDIIKKYQYNNPHIKLIDNEKRSVPYALNKAIKLSIGEIIIRVDLHAIYPTNYLSELCKQLEELRADNVGGVCVTLPANNKIQSEAIAIGMSSWFGVGNSYFRIGADSVTEVDTVPFGCFHRELFERIGMFDEELTRNQDDEFNGRIINNGGKIYLLPYLKIKYFARDKVSKMANMFYQYGLFKPLVNIKLGSPATIRQFAPICFVSGLFIGGILSIFSIWFFVLYISILVLYMFLGIYACRKEINSNPLLLLYLPWIFMVIHISYGWGYIVGLYKFKVLKKTTTIVDINR